jgi:hypothetical protein
LNRLARPTPAPCQPHRGLLLSKARSATHRPRPCHCRSLPRTRQPPSRTSCPEVQSMARVNPVAGTGPSQAPGITAAHRRPRRGGSHES